MKIRVSKSEKIELRLTHLGNQRFLSLSVFNRWLSVESLYLNKKTALRFQEHLRQFCKAGE